MRNLKIEIDDLCRELKTEGGSLHAFLPDLQRGKILAALKGYETHPKQDVVMGLFDAMQGLNDRRPEYAAEILKLSNHIGRIFVALNASEIEGNVELRDAAQEESSYLKRSLAAVKNFKDTFLNLSESAATAPDDTRDLYNKILEVVRRLEAKLIEIERILKSDDLRNELQKFIEANSGRTQNETKLPLSSQLKALPRLAFSAACLSLYSLEAALITGIPAVLAALNVSHEQLKTLIGPAENLLNTLHNALNRAFENDIEALGYKHEDVKAMLGDIKEAVDSIKSIAPMDSGSANPLNEALKSTIASMDDTLSDVERLSEVEELSDIRRDTSGPSSPKPSWASDSNTDEYGRWAEFEYKGIVQRLRWCPAGSFVMGSPEDEERRWNNEGPQTGIIFKNGFWMFDTPVTQRLYRAVMGANPSKFQEGKDAGKRPVESVSWNEAQIFLQKLNELKNLSLSLPSEAEWEYACRAGTSGPRYADDLDTIAWYERNSRRQTHPVAQKTANLWGLYDTLGNVQEWCADVWAESHEGADPTGLLRQSQSNTNCVVRGGAWRFRAGFSRAASRNGVASINHKFYLGFRPIQRAGQDK